MIKNGYVVSATEEKAKIRINRESSCGGNCAHCKGCGTDELIIEVENDNEFCEGEIVRVIMDNKKFLKRAVLGYGALVAAMILGGVLGYAIFGSEVASAVFVIAFLAITLFLMRKGFGKTASDIKVERVL